MKLIQVTQEQFDRLWQKLQPQQRYMVDDLLVPAISLRMMGVSAIVVVRGDVEVLGYPTTEEMRIYDAVMLGR